MIPIAPHITAFVQERLPHERCASPHTSDPRAIVAYVCHEISIRGILDHLGLSPPEQEKPPPIREVVRVPVDREGRETELDPPDLQTLAIRRAHLGERTA